MANDDSGGWLVQVSVKHGPEDSKGNPLYLTNVRGYTVRDVREQAAELAEWADRLFKDVAAFTAVGAVRERFPDSERVPERDRPRASSEGKSCAHGTREYRTGSKDGKPWAGWFCQSQSKADKCAVMWLD